MNLYFSIAHPKTYKTHKIEERCWKLTQNTQ